MEDERVVNFPCDPEYLTSNQYLRASISSDGRVSNIQPNASPHWACLDKLRKTLESWSFYPALQNGNPSDSELDILLRFYREDQRKRENYGWVSREEIRGPTVVIDFVQVTAKPAKWVVFYGPQAFGITNESPGGNSDKSANGKGINR